MKGRVAQVLTLAAALAAAAGCATTSEAVSRPPDVEVSELRSTSITPDLVKFQSRILIDNRSSSSLDFERVDYAVDLFDRELFNDAFSDMKRTKGRGHETVTFHFQIAMKDILDQAPALLAEGSMRVTFRGTVYPEASSGYEAQPFSRTVVIPIPRIPEVALTGTEGLPLSDGFRVRLRVHNTNSFPITISSVESYLDVNQVRYRLVHSEEATELGPDSSGNLFLRMENTKGKTLSLLLNTLQSPSPKFTLGGTITCSTPYGWVIIPVALQNEARQ
jgi:LEA14-like dessication related protein